MRMLLPKTKKKKNDKSQENQDDVHRRWSMVRFQIAADHVDKGDVEKRSGAETLQNAIDGSQL